MGTRPPSVTSESAITFNLIALFREIETRAESLYYNCEPLSRSGGFTSSCANQTAFAAWGHNQTRTRPLPGW